MMMLSSVSEVNSRQMYFCQQLQLLGNTDSINGANCLSAENADKI